MVPSVVLFYFFVHLLNSTHAAKDACSNASLPKSMVNDTGDYLVGALVPVHVEEQNSTNCKIGDPNYSFIRSRDGTCICYRINDSGIMWAEAVRYAVQQVNDQKMLGENIMMGYDIRDSVNNVDVALEIAFNFTTKRRRTVKSGTNQNTSQCTCNENKTDPYVMALIGGARSEISQRVNHVLGVAALPQISYSSTSVSLSDKDTYRTFLRTIPPDNYQARAMADIARHFGWYYVATVATDEDYGRRGVLGFHEEARKLGICISTHKLFHHNTSLEETKVQVRTIIKELKEDKKTNVIVLFCERPRALFVLDEAQRQGMTGKTWIASEDWGSAEKVYEYKEEVVGGILGVITYEPEIEPFSKYLETITPSSRQDNPWVKEYFETIVCHQGEKDCRRDASVIHRNKAGYVMDSVYTVARALKKYLECQKSGIPECPKQLNFNKLREFMLGLTFTGATESIVAFDKYGNPEGKYEISNIQRDPQARHGKKFVTVGTWTNGTLKFTKPITWNGLKNETPSSNCSTICPAGKHYVSGDLICCWDCVLCPVGMFKVQVGNSEKCDRCPEGYISNQNRTQCMRIPEEFIRWDSVTSAVLVSLSLFGVLIASFMLGVYFKFRNSPIVKASSRYPSLLLLITIALMFALPLLYIGRPNSVQCHAQPIAYGLLMTLATSLVFTKTFRLIQIFNNVVTNVRDKPLVTVRTQFGIVAFFLVVEVIIIAVFLDQRPMEIRTVVQDTAVPIDCGRSAKDLHITLLLYNGILAIICAFMAFRARSLPANFSEARLISFAMFTFSVIWLTFLITFSGSLMRNLSTFICIAIIATALDLLVCMFGPKIWVILFRPELNEMHVVRADIYRYTLKQRTRSHTPQYDNNSESEFERARCNTRPESDMPAAAPKDFDCSFQESKL